MVYLSLPLEYAKGVSNVDVIDSTDVIDNVCATNLTEGLPQFTFVLEGMIPGDVLVPTDGTDPICVPSLHPGKRRFTFGR